MSKLTLHHDIGRAVSLHVDGALLCRYVYVSDVAGKETPKPYFHPVNSLKGDTLTNFRPNDHPWHHALAMTLNNVSGANFWGGPTCRKEDGYKWRDDHGEQAHTAWTKLEVNGPTAKLAHTVTWRTPQETFFIEERSIEINVDAEKKTWSLHWRSALLNKTGRVLSLGNPHSHGGLAGSHYTGLQFRGTRDLLDDHLDPTIKVVAEGGLEGIPAVHGALANWMEWHVQSDTSLNRAVIRFTNNTGPLHWFVRRNYPLAAFPVQFDQNKEIPAGDTLVMDHTLTFTSL